MLEKEIIIGILEHINNANLTRGVYTTYDQGLAESIRQDIINSIKQHYNVEYTIHVKGMQTFPVKGILS
jgi:hypothetical protein